MTRAPGDAVRLIDDEDGDDEDGDDEAEPDDDDEDDDSDLSAEEAAIHLVEE